MPNAHDRILIVESDPAISDLVGRQILHGAGFQVAVVADVNQAINRALNWAPDLILADLNLSGLSVNDLMVALNAQGLQTPVVVFGPKGMETHIIQAFRLGATDFLAWPAREAEVISAVERALKQVRAHKERELLAQTLKQTNRELQQRVRELTTIFAIGKAVTSTTDQTLLFEKILDGSMKVSRADLGWFLLREDRTKTFHLMAYRNLPSGLQVHLNQPWDDGISSLVALSGEPLSIHGEPIKRFKIATLGQSTLIVPVKVQKQVVGLLVMLRRKAAAFSESDKHILQALADYASISLVNAHLFQAVEDRARAQQQQAEAAQFGERINADILQKVKKELQEPTETARQSLNRLAKDPTGDWTPDQQKLLVTMHRQLDRLCQVSEAIAVLSARATGELPSADRKISLNDLVRQTVGHFTPIAQPNHIRLVMQLPDEAVIVTGDKNQMVQVLHGLVSNAIKFCGANGQVTVKVEKNIEDSAHVVVSDSGVGIDQRLSERLFEGHHAADKPRPRRFGGLGISMRLIKEIIARHNGSIWVENTPGSGAQFHFTLPARQ